MVVVEASASAPGKILWIGGYSVLERPNVSYVTAVKSYVHVAIRPMADKEVVLDAPQLNLRAAGGIDSEGVLGIEVPKELLLLKTAVGTASRYASAKGAKMEGFAVHTKNDDAFSYSIEGGRIVKSGLGSSAALTVAAVAATLKAMGVAANRDKVHKLAQIAHSLSTGKVGSGFDIAAASFGSIVYSRYSPDLVKSLPADFSNDDLLRLARKRWDYTAEKLSLPDDFKVTFANFVGEAMITTAGVGSVSEFKKDNPGRYGEIIKSLNECNVDAIDALRKVGKGERDALAGFKEAFEKGRSLTKTLGVLSNVGIEPDDCTGLIERSKENGAYVSKLPGAGGKDAIAAISLSRPDQTRLRRFWRKNKELSLLKIRMGKKGFKAQ